MATTATITPTLGSAPVTLQAGNYSAIDDRRFWGAGLDEYVLTNTSYEVIQRAAGANMTVDVTSSLGDGALVKGDSVTAQGLYMVPPTAANVNVDIAAADATNPRNDLVVLEVKDDQHDAGGLNLARVRVITGTPNASAALTSGFGVNGTPALPSSCLPLAVVRVAAGATSIATAAINDRRTWSPYTLWKPWTPTITQNGTRTSTNTYSRYIQNGKLVIAYSNVLITQAGSAGSGIGATLPVAARQASGEYPIGTFIYYNGAFRYTGVIGPGSFGGGDVIFQVTGNASAMGNLPSFATANGDELRMMLTYEAA